FGAVQAPYMVQGGGYGGQVGRRPGPGNGGMRGQQGQNPNYQGGNARPGQQNRMQGNAMPQGQPGVRPQVGQMGGKGQQQQAMYPAQYMGGARQGAPMMLEPLTTQRLAQANPQEQKQLLGERIYPLIQRCSSLERYERHCWI
uniref:QLQ domain-containing protein n=1 Tax=Steinernema glaseri TaxID=37863 RepID=A0A1I8AAX6_9BILA